MKQKQITHWLKVIVIGVVFGFALQFVRAWTEPTSSPPNGNVGAPINTGKSPQYKEGSLAVYGAGGGYGVYGQSPFGAHGALGTDDGYGVYGYGSYDGVYGQNSSDTTGNTYAHLGLHLVDKYYGGYFSGKDYGVYGQSSSGAYGTLGNGDWGVVSGGPMWVAGTIKGQAATGSGDVLTIGNDSKLVDINKENTAGLYGIQDTTVGSLKLGSGGGKISGKNGSVGIGTDNPGYKLDVAGDAKGARLCIGNDCRDKWPENTGPQGPPGATGATGPQGPAGPSGAAACTCISVISCDGNQSIEYVTKRNCGAGEVQVLAWRMNVMKGYGETSCSGIYSYPCNPY